MVSGWLVKLVMRFCEDGGVLGASSVYLSEISLTLEQKKVMKFRSVSLVKWVVSMHRVLISNVDLLIFNG